MIVETPLTIEVVAWHMNAKQTMSVYHCVVLIYAIGCSTITYKVLGTSSNIFPG